MIPKLVAVFGDTLTIDPKLETDDVQEDVEENKAEDLESVKTDNSTALADKQTYQTGKGMKKALRFRMHFRVFKII